MRMHLYALALGCIMIGIFACNKEVQPVVPEDGNITKINFCASSDVLALYNMGSVGIFIDSPVVKRAGFTPFLNLSSRPQKLEYPTIHSSVPAIVYMSFRAGMHRFRFNYMVPDTTTTMEGILPNRMLTDTSFSVDRGAATLLWLADKPLTAEDQDPAFQLLKVQLDERIKTDSNTVAVYILHLAADAGALRCSRVLPDGKLSPDQVPQNLGYGQVTDGVLFNIKTASNGLLGLRFYDKATGGELVNTAVPASGGHGYVLVIQGFRNDHQFKIPVSLNEDKTVNYSTKIVTANLRSGLRQLW